MTDSACLTILCRAVLWVCLLSCVSADAADRRKEPVLPPAPPPVVSRQVAVVAGESVVIPLAVHGRRNEQMEFVIRSRPKLGKLSALTSTGVNSATITYIAPGNAATGEDRFAFAVRSKDGVSAPGLITINLSAKPTLPSKLGAPDSLEFPATLAGQTSTQQFVVRNAGGGIASGAVTVPAPWTLEDGAEYRLGRDAQTTFRVTFRPEKEGAFAGDLVLGPEPSRIIKLSGEGRASIVAAPTRVILQTAKQGQTRMGVFTLENRAEEPWTVQLSADPRLITDKSVVLPAGGKIEVPVFAEPGNGEPFEEQVQLAAGAWKGEVQVEVPALLPRLKVTADPASMQARRAEEPVAFTALVENLGGRSVTALVQVNRPFGVGEPTVTVAPGDKKILQITGPPLSPGAHPVELTVQTDSAIERLKLSYEVAETVATAPPAAQSRARPMQMARMAFTSSAQAQGPAEALELDDAPVPAEGTRQIKLEEQPNVMGKFAREITANRAVLVWPVDLGPAVDLSVEERQLTRGSDGRLVISWRPLAGVEIQTANGTCRAELPRLEPAQIHTVRVRTGDTWLFTSQFSTPPKPPLLPFGWRGGTVALLLAALAVLGWRWWKTRGKSSW